MEKTLLSVIYPSLKKFKMSTEKNFFVGNLSSL